MSFLEVSEDNTVGEIRHNIETEWKIPDFFSLLEEDDKWYYSPAAVFSFNDSSYFMRIKQIRENSCTEDKYIDLSLSLGFADHYVVDNVNVFCSQTTKLNVFFSLKTSIGFKENETQCTSFYGKYEEECYFHNFISKSELLRRNSELLPDGVLTIVCSIVSAEPSFSAINRAATTLCPHCKMTLDAESILSHEFYCMVKCPKCGDDVILQLWHEHDCRETNTKASCNNQSEFVFDINHLLEKGKGTDVTFLLKTVSGKMKVHAHQLILAARSSYFENRFFSKQRNDKRQVIPLKGINPKAFQQMIRYCYGFELDLKDIKEACFLFKVASEFKVNRLVELCHSSIKVEPRNVFSILEVLERTETNMEVLKQNHKDMCYEILQAKTAEVLGSFELCEITPNMVDIILNLPKLSFKSEFELIQWLFDWAKIKYTDDSICKNSREYLHKLLPSMNFLSLTFEEFAVLCKDHPGFFSSDEMVSVYQNIACPGTKEMPEWYRKDIKHRVYTGLKK